MLQILILASVALFLFWRLYLVLGTRTGFEKNLNDSKINVSGKHSQNDEEKFNKESQEEDISDYVELSSKLGKSFQKIKEVEPNFTVNSSSTEYSVS